MTSLFIGLIGIAIGAIAGFCYGVRTSTIALGDMLETYGGEGNYFTWQGVEYEVKTCTD